MQNLIRECWVGANGKEWKSQEHIDGEYKALCKGNSLKAKSEGLSKMFNEMGSEKLNEAIWEVMKGRISTQAGPREVDQIRAEHVKPVLEFWARENAQIFARTVVDSR